MSSWSAFVIVLGPFYLLVGFGWPHTLVFSQLTMEGNSMFELENPKDLYNVGQGTFMALH